MTLRQFIEDLRNLPEEALDATVISRNGTEIRSVSYITDDEDGDMELLEPYVLIDYSL